MNKVTLILIDSPTSFFLIIITIFDDGTSSLKPYSHLKIFCQTRTISKNQNCSNEKNAYMFLCSFSIDNSRQSTMDNDRDNSRGKYK